MAVTQPYLSHLTGVFHAPVQAWSRSAGEMEQGAEGIYCADDRVVSHARLTVAGHELRALNVQVVSATEAVFRYVVAVPAEVPDPLLTLTRRRRATAEGISEELTLGSALREPVRVDLELALTVDCTPMEQVKVGRGAPDRPRPSSQRWSWRDADTQAALEDRKSVV